ncbi:Ig-like domain-containing protein, partial [uncultured Anaerococcus sp.]|uniref:Ig-like domain-containing protein n=1 Tax=uncultured Anaerococcus sp. TaxID=293428 RepID=UPI00288AD55F
GSSEEKEVPVTVKDTTPAQKDADKITPNVPTEKTGVKDLDKLTDKEKEEVKGKIEEANKDKFPEGTKVDVDDKGNATITYPDGSKDTIPAEDLVFQYKHGEPEISDKPELKIADIIDPTVPGKTEVGDKDNLTDKEKEEIKDKIEKANKDKFPEGTKVDVDNKGNATITYPDGSKDVIPADKLVNEKDKNNQSQAPKVNQPAEGDKKITGTGVPGAEILIKDKNGNVIGKTIVDKNGNWVVNVPENMPLKKGDVIFVEQREKGKTPTVIDVTVRGNDSEYRPGEPLIPEANADEGEDNNKPEDGDKKDKQGSTQTEAKNNPAQIPSEKTGVKDKNHLTDEEKQEIIDKIKKANPAAVEVKVDDKGNATLIYADGSKNFIKASDLVYEKEAKKAPSQSGNVDPARNVNPNSKQAGKNVKTGVGSVSGILGLAGISIAGLLASKKKEEEDK